MMKLYCQLMTLQSKSTEVQEMNIQIRNKLKRHIVLVADIASEGLLGTDFLRLHQMIIDFAANKILSDVDPVIVRCQEGSDQERRVYVAETIVVWAGTRITKGKTMKPLATVSWVLAPLRGKKQDEKFLVRLRNQNFSGGCESS